MSDKLRWLAWFGQLQISPHPRQTREIAMRDKEKWERGQKRSSGRIRVAEVVAIREESDMEVEHDQPVADNG